MAGGGGGGGCLIDADFGGEEERVREGVGLLMDDEDGRSDEGGNGWGCARAIEEEGDE